MKKQAWKEALEAALTRADRDNPDSEISLVTLLDSLISVRQAEIGEEFDTLNDLTFKRKLTAKEKHLLAYLRVSLFD